MTGFWSGKYWFSDSGLPVHPFIANIEDVDGILSGTTSETNVIGTSSPRLRAIVVGSRVGRSFEFSKQYDGASDAAHRVDYFGTISDDGTSAGGEWRLETWSGGFRMTRPQIADFENAVGSQLILDARDELGGPS